MRWGPRAINWQSLFSITGITRECYSPYYQILVNKSRKSVLLIRAPSGFSLFMMDMIVVLFVLVIVLMMVIAVLLKKFYGIWNFNFLGAVSYCLIT